MSAQSCRQRQVSGSGFEAAWQGRFCGDAISRAVVGTFLCVLFSHSPQFDSVFLDFEALRNSCLRFGPVSTFRRWRCSELIVNL